MIRDMIDKPLTKDNTNKKRNNDLQRALVLQGGGALAAYEVGVCGVLYFWRRKEIEKKNGRNDDHIFDIISGTSGGAIKGWIVINHVLNKINQGYSVTDSWKGSFKKLLDFWDYTSSSPDFTKWGPYSMALEVESIPGFTPMLCGNGHPIKRHGYQDGIRSMKKLTNLKRQERLKNLWLSRGC